MKILTLSGWAQDHEALTPLLDMPMEAEHYSDHADYAAWKRAHSERKYDVVIGWSLGGQLAVRALNDKWLSARKLILIGTPYQFVANHRFSHAMEPWLFGQFVENYQMDPQRTAKRFRGLIAKNDMREKEVSRSLRLHAEVERKERWAGWLKELEGTGFDTVSSDFPETLVIHGEKDSLVKYAQAQHLEDILPHSSLYSLPHAAHAPHLHDKAQVQAAMHRFLEST